MELLAKNRVQERFWVCAFLISMISDKYTSNLWFGEKEAFCVAQVRGTWGGESCTFGLCEHFRRALQPAQERF